MLLLELSALKVEDSGLTDTLVTFYQTTQLHFEEVFINGENSSTRFIWIFLNLNMWLVWEGEKHFFSALQSDMKERPIRGLFLFV